MRRLLATVGGALALASPLAVAPAAAANTTCANADLVPTADNRRIVEDAVLCLLNRERAAAGRVPLARAPNLDRSALFHTAEMIRFHFLDHEADGRPTLLARVRGYGYFNGASDGLYAENVGAGPTTNGTARALMTAWMKSPGHRANLLFAPFRDVGIAAYPAPPDRAFFADYPSTVYTTDFGRRYVRRRCAPPKPSQGPQRGSASPRSRYCRRAR